MLTNSVVILKGTSGTGKGTRFNQLLMYLDYHYDTEIVNYDIDGRDYAVAIKIPDLKILLLGKYTRSNKSGLVSLTGLDIMQSGWPVNMVEYLIDGHEGYNFMAEGYGCMLGSYYGPMNMLERFGIKNQLWGYYKYDNFEQVQKRIVGRSGKRIKGSCWASEVPFDEEYHKSVVPTLWEKRFELGKTEHFQHMYSAPVHQFGIDYLGFLELYDHIPSFQEFCDRVDCRRSIVQKQDLSIFPQHLLPGDLSKSIPPDPVEPEDFRRRMKALHPSEPLVVWDKTLKQLGRMLWQHTVEDSWEFNQLRKEYGLTMYHNLLKSLANAESDPYLTDVIKEHEHVIYQFSKIKRV